MLCNITQNAMGQTPGRGYPYPIMLCKITQNSMGQTPRRGTLPGPAGGGILPGGYPTGGTLLGVPYLGTPQVRTGGTLPGGDTQLGQQKEYSLRGGRYASCVHAGGLSCFIVICLFYVHDHLEAWIVSHVGEKVCSFL